MPRSQSHPDWRLPQGVTHALWEYAQADHIAEDYDDYFAYNSLFEFDNALLTRHFTKPGVLVDLGCGTGRLLVPFARKGFQCVAVDLSRPMLEVVGRKAEAERLPIDRVLTNFVQLDGLKDASADYVICMFSTLGMVRGRANRAIVLRHVARLLKPDGLFVLHLHNRWYNLFDAQGRGWLVGNALRSLRGIEEPGDKVFDYRGIPNMFLHVFTRGEMLRDLRHAGLEVMELTALDTQRRHALRWPRLFGRLRANGWIAVCRLHRC